MLETLKHSSAVRGQVVVKANKARPFYGRHPWVLDSAVERIEGDPDAADVVDLVDARGKWIARGILNTRSRIRVRLYSWTPGEALDEAFWRRRIEAAVRFREQLGLADPQGAARLIFSEADGLSGLVVDRFADYLSVQPTALAITARLDDLLPILADVTGAKGVVLRSERGMADLEGMHFDEGFRWGTAPDGPIFITEHGIRYGVDLSTGQKTGFYVDQRENRRRAAEYARGRRVLDLFCYTGGFGLSAALLGEAREVLCVDGSAKAIAVAKANAELNGARNVRCEAADAFETLDALRAESQRFGMIILDPPKFARSRRSVEEALRAYHRINRLAVELLEPDGILVTCSCTGSVSRDDFLYMLVGVAQQSGRNIQILEQRGASPDHPVSAFCLESEYLKCFICRVS